MGRLNFKKAGAVLISLSLILNCTSCTSQKDKGNNKENPSSRQEATTNMPATISTFNRETPADAKEYNITINGNDIHTDNKNGLTYKGFGILSGNSTSDLLMDYKAENPEAYARLMQYLFGGEYPLINHVKLEMGNDRNNSTGPEAATKRSKDEVTNILRNPGWQLAADAKRINPDIKTSILKWNSPAWVKTGKDIYNWYKEAILAAYAQYGFIVDYINPNTNERWDGEADVKFTKEFAKLIDEEKEYSKLT